MILLLKLVTELVEVGGDIINTPLASVGDQHVPGAVIGGNGLHRLWLGEVLLQEALERF